jgi:hypothetical protein
MIHNLLAILIILLGLGGAVIVGSIWQDLPFLHLFPIVYGFVAYLLFRLLNPVGAWSWSAPIAMAAVLYGLAWLSAWQERRSDRN